MKYIYTIHYCDQWESHDSMRLQVVTTSVRKFIRELKSMLKSGDIEFNDDKKHGEERFKLVITAQLCPSSLCYELNKLLDYAYCEAWED